LTGVADTRLLLTLEFPATPQVKLRIRDFFELQLREGLVAPSIILTEFVKYAGLRIGEEAARTRLRLLKEQGLRIASVEEKNALIAGALLLSNQNVPLADALIASYVKTGEADYVITDDPHYKTLNIKTKWVP